MERMHGENAQRYAERQLAQAGAKQVNEAYRAGKLELGNVESTPACTCNFLPYPHFITDPGRKRFHDSPRSWRSNVD